MLLVAKFKTRKLRREDSWPKCLPTAWWCKHPRDSFGFTSGQADSAVALLRLRLIS